MKQLFQFFTIYLIGVTGVQIALALAAVFCVLKALGGKVVTSRIEYKSRKRIKAFEADMWAID
ncbi:hypothetical protein EXU57_14360 [Segetibacter sp. 3557_3]|uniref:hypothetical protein n=1 Tax=Segetibacter sp. 3557_3 TaxID=2547429 RepID=UPI001058A9E0|nr:hypothetical protein [Segetibacter sp. 3557_3]TDH24525.1 hypothetical protein EXU57_14360 [Segetibacter sp. 3557_3]